MAQAQWGKVYYKDIFAGRLVEEPGGRCIFTYDESYYEDGNPSISHTFPIHQHQTYSSEQGLHSFFDNLVAEGWFRNAQAKALGINPKDRFGLLLGFGFDLAGAVSVIDPDPQEKHTLDHSDEATVAALLGRASLSGVQRKLLVVKDGDEYRPVGSNELSTHIAKLASGNLNNLVELEYLTTLAARKLLPDDDIVDMEIVTIPAINEEALIIPRFDRSESGKRLHHFEEFNQLLGRFSGEDKYEGSYEDMGQFILNTPDCVPAEADRLLQRILVCFLIGNTDAHFKNFAMFHTRDGLRLTPAYDLVASSVYKEYQSIALHVSGIRNLAIGGLEPKHILRMIGGFGVSGDALMDTIEKLEKRLPDALEALEKSDVGDKELREQLIDRMNKRWNGSFRSIGQVLSKRQNKDAKTSG